VNWGEHGSGGSSDDEGRERRVGTDVSNVMKLKTEEDKKEVMEKKGKLKGEKYG